MKIPVLLQFKIQKAKCKIAVQKSKLNITFKFLLLLLTFNFALLTYALPVKAQQSLPHQASNLQQNSYTTPNTNPNVPKNFYNYTQSVMLEVASGLSCLIAGVDPVNPNGKCLGFDTKTGKIGYMESGGGAIGAMGNMITMLYTPPAHTRDYVINLAQNFGITKTAFAKLMMEDCRDSASHCTTPAISPSGSGFQGLSPLIKVWEIFRNIVYLLFVLVFIVIGVAVMLRVKIDPRTVMTIQNQIPKIVIGLILVTFSFAIAGFLIDLMWVAIYLFYGIFASIPGVNVTSLNPQEVAGANPIGAIGGLGGIGSIAKHASGSIKSVMTGLLDGSFGNVIGGLIGSIFWPVAIAELIFGAGKTLGFIAGLIAYIIICIALMWALLRVWFTLLTAYVMILIDVVFAPFWIVAGLVPGSKLNFSAWVRDIVANLAAFPTVFIMFLLGKTFMEAFSNGRGQFVPPFIGNPGDMKAFGALIGLGIILTTPTAVKMMKTAFNAPQLDISSIGAAVGVGASVPASAARSTASYFSKQAPLGEKAGIWGVARNMMKF